MRTIQPIIAILCCLLLLAPVGLAQDEPGQPQLSNQSWHSALTHPYTPAYIPPVNVTNTNRLSQLIMAGNLYLSLRDAVALALENNVTIEVQRYQFDITDWAVTGATGTLLDPVFSTTGQGINWGRNANIVTNPYQGGGQAVNAGNSQNRNVQIAKTFGTGATGTLSFNNSRTTTNNPNTTFVPQLSSSLGLNMTQPLLNGFGTAFNRRNITIANNNKTLSNYQFRPRSTPSSTT